MPNWCYNKVDVTGNKESLNKLKKLIGDDFDFNNVIPMPGEFEESNYNKLSEEEKKELITKYGAKNWYDWQLENWSVKWGCTNFEADWQDDMAQLRFETPWAPPENICFKLQSLFSDLNFTWFYDEPGMQIAGYLN